jgi:hypothetical protein
VISVTAVITNIHQCLGFDLSRRTVLHRVSQK